MSFLSENIALKFGFTNINHRKGTENDIKFIEIIGFEKNVKMAFYKKNKNKTYNFERPTIMNIN